MPEVSENDLQSIRERNEELREQIAAARASQAEVEAEKARQLEAVQLTAENIRLENELKVAQTAVEVESDENTSFRAAKERILQAQAQSTQVGVVDTNAEVELQRDENDELVLSDTGNPVPANEDVAGVDEGDGSPPLPDENEESVDPSDLDSDDEPSSSEADAVISSVTADFDIYDNERE